MKFHVSYPAGRAPVCVHRELKSGQTLLSPRAHIEKTATYGPPPRVLALADHLGHAKGRVHGGTTYFANVFPALVKAGLDLTVVFLQPDHPAASSLRDRGVQPRFLGLSKWDPHAWHRVKELIDEVNPSVLHLASFRSHYLGRLHSRGHAIRSIVHLHDTAALSPWMKVLQRSVRRDDDLAVGVSAAVTALGRRDYGFNPSQSRVLHNGLDLSAFQIDRPDARAQLRRELSLPATAPLIAAIGRLSKPKGHRYLIAAMPAILERCPEARLLLIGQGPLESRLRKRIAFMGLEHRVLLLGQRRDIPSILQAIDVVAMPSVSHEGLPYSAVEAIASGRPVVAFPDAGLPDIVVDGHTGLLTPKRNVPRLAEALGDILTQPELAQRLSNGGRAHAQQFSLQAHVRSLMKIYAELSDATMRAQAAPAGSPANPQPSFGIDAPRITGVLPEPATVKRGWHARRSL